MGRRYSHALGRVRIDSDFDLGLPQAVRDRCDLVLTVRSTRFDPEAPGAIRLGSGSFSIEPASRAILYERGEGASGEHLARELLDVLLPESLALAGEVVLHASVVSLEDRAILLSGTSRSGKSTLALSLESFGWKACADDFALVGDDLTVEVFGGPRRVWPDVAGALAKDELSRTSTGKMIITGAWEPRSLPIDAVAILAPSESSVLIDDLSGAEAFEVLIRSCFRPPGSDDASIRRQIDRLSRLANERPVVSLSIPHDLASLDRSAAAASDLLKGFLS